MLFREKIIMQPCLSRLGYFGKLSFKGKRFFFLTCFIFYTIYFILPVVPLTSSVGKLYPSETYVTFCGKKAKAMADQLTTVSKKRLINPAGSISSTEMEGIG
jgi:hypothetical protein